MSGNDNKNTGNRSPWTLKRVAAIAGIILLAGLYLLTFISACIGTESTGKLFRFSLGMTIAVPIFLWIFIWCAGKFTGRHTMASMDILNSNPEERRKMEEALQRNARPAGDGKKSPDGEKGGAKH